MEEVFSMDSAYSEQAAVLLQRARSSPGGTCVWSKGFLPVRVLPPGYYSTVLQLLTAARLPGTQQRSCGIMSSLDSSCSC